MDAACCTRSGAIIISCRTVLRLGSIPTASSAHRFLNRIPRRSACRYHGGADLTFATSTSWPCFDLDRPHRPGAHPSPLPGVATAVPGPFPELSSLPQPHPSPFRADPPLIIATAPTWLSLPRRHELASTSTSVIAGTPATGGDHCRSWALSGTIRVPVPHACPRTH